MSNGSFPIISVADLTTAVSFYRRLGFVQTYAFPDDDDAVFVTLERGGSTLGIASLEPGSADRFATWLYVDDVDATFGALTAGGAPVVAEPRTKPWGERIASVRDPAGNLVHLGSPVGRT